MSETFQWVDAGGAVHDFDDANARVLRGVQGRFMPPVQHVEEEVPFQPGARLRRSKTLVREVDVPMLFRATDASAMRGALRDWARRFNVDAGPGKLRVTAPAGDTRELNAVYAGGFEGSEGADDRGAAFQRAVVVFRALDPYWYDASEVSVLYEQGASALTFFPFFPLRLTSGALAEATVDNTGDGDAWPRWTITGPGSDPVLRNLTTGKTLSLSLTLAAGDTITVDTRPGEKTVRDQNGTSRYDSLTNASSFWPLAIGTNAIRVDLAGAGVGSSVLLRYARRYLTV